jgi:hypothetical protein
MKSDFKTCNAINVSVYPSSNIYHRVWLKLEDSLNDNTVSTELTKWDCEILIAILKRAKQYLEEG